MRRAKLQALDAINSLCLDAYHDEENVTDVLETLGENIDFETNVTQTTDEFEPAEDDLLNETHLCDIDGQNTCGADSDDDLIESAGDFDESSLTSPSGLKWRMSKGPRHHEGRMKANNVFSGKPFEIKRGLHPQNEKESVLLFLDELFDDCVQYTNLYARRMISDYNRKNNAKKCWKPTDRTEIEAFFGLLILAGAFKSHYRSTTDLWSLRDGQPIFRATMSRERFCQIKSMLRFDDTLRRDRSDALAPVRHLVSNFILRLREFVTAPPYLTIDEQLLEYHGRVRFRQYIASKPGKFGIKIYWLTSSDGEYVFNGIVYIGADSLDQKFVQLSSGHAEAVVNQLMEPFLRNGRNVTLDNFFTSTSLADRLLRENTTLVGTIRRNKRCIPPAALDLKSRSKGDVRFFYNDEKLLCSFWDKGTKPVLLLDSFIPNSEDHDRNHQLPDCVRFYNATKSGVDIVDKKIRAFSCKRKCNRWPVAVICNMVDVACINASFIFTHSGEFSSEMSHLDFLKQCGYQLTHACIQRRTTHEKSLQREVRMAMELCGYTLTSRRPPSLDGFLQKPKRCEFCPTSRDRKSKSFCWKCLKVICVEHSCKVCHNCASF